MVNFMHFWEFDSFSEAIKRVSRIWGFSKTVPMGVVITVSAPG